MGKIYRSCGNLATTRTWDLKPYHRLGGWFPREAKDPVGVR